MFILRVQVVRTSHYTKSLGTGSAVRCRTSERRGNAEPSSKSNVAICSTAWKPSGTHGFVDQIYSKFIKYRCFYTVNLQCLEPLDFQHAEDMALSKPSPADLSQVESNVYLNANVSSAKMQVSGAVPAHSTGHMDAIVPKGGCRKSQTSRARLQGRTMQNMFIKFNI